MADLGLHSRSVVEAQNISVGSGGSEFIDDTASHTPTKGKYVAITIIADSTAFTNLIPTIKGKYVGTVTGGGLNIDSSNTFPAGITLFGKWDEIKLEADGVVIAYKG